MPTKKELEVRFELSATTIYETLKACGLDTSRREYTEAEIQERFIPARDMLNANKTLTDVRNYFAAKDNQASASAVEVLPTDEATTDEFMGLVENEITESVNEVVKKAVAAMIPLIPRMVFAALEEQARNGNIRRAFMQFREEYRQNLELDSTLQRTITALGSSGNEEGSEEGDLPESPLEN